MNIAFDFFLQFPEAVKEVNKDPELDTFFMELLMFVMERLKPLEDKIDAEENVNGNDGSKGTIICILRDDGRFIHFGGYSDELTTKMLACFSEDDIKFILQKIVQINISRNN